MTQTDRHERNAVAEMVKAIEHRGCTCPPEDADWCEGDCAGLFQHVQDEMDGTDLKDALEAVRRAFDL